MYRYFHLLDERTILKKKANQNIFSELDTRYMQEMCLTRVSTTQGAQGKKKDSGKTQGI